MSIIEIPTSGDRSNRVPFHRLGPPKSTSAIQNHIAEAWPALRAHQRSRVDTMGRGKRTMMISRTRYYKTMSFRAPSFTLIIPHLHLYSFYLFWMRIFLPFLPFLRYASSVWYTWCVTTCASLEDKKSTVIWMLSSLRAARLTCQPVGLQHTLHQRKGGV
jgi:hypothetical protein